ncbi:tyrosine--tRNA ligase [Gracilaria domingensis]|nr:tyrosine--tRNA ligase [Gracilaria domingensis]
MKSPQYVPNTAQKRLAEEVTRIVHGDEGVQSALAATAAAAPGSSAVLSVEALEAIASDMPSASFGVHEIVGVGVVDLMVKGGLQKSKGEARRLIRNGGGYLNNQKITDERAVLDSEDLVGGKLALLAAGKKNKLLVRVK